MLDNVSSIILELIFEQSGVVAITDENARYIFVNKKWESDTGVSRKAAIGKHSNEIVYGSRAVEAMMIKKPIIATHRIAKLNGDELPGVISYMPILNNGESIGCYITSAFLDYDSAKDFIKKFHFANKETEFFNTTPARKAKKSSKYTINDIIGKSDEIKKLKEQIYFAGNSNSTILIEGESGTGKELVAHSIHDISYRNNNPFVKVNCSAIPGTLFESEFFGYEPGSYTGAYKGGREGKFQMANNGTIFLDEINQMNISMQPKLLKVLQEKEIEKIGSSDTITIDVRTIAATTTPLKNLIKSGKFRSDLYYKLNVIHIMVPPLRKRREDIFLLVSSMLDSMREENGSIVTNITDEAMNYLLQYDWPGNVRELRNVLEKAINNSRTNLIDVGDLEFDDQILIGNEVALFYSKIEKESQQDYEQYQSLKSKKNNAEKNAIINALRKCNNNKAQAARMLEISRTLLYKRIEKYDL